MSAPAITSVQSRNLNLLEYQSKGLLLDYGVTVQKFRMATNDEEAAKIPADFPCEEYVIKAQVLAGGRGKGYFDNGFKGGVHLTKDPLAVPELCTAMIHNDCKQVGYHNNNICSISVLILSLGLNFVLFRLITKQTPPGDIPDS